MLFICKEKSIYIFAEVRKKGLKSANRKSTNYKSANHKKIVSAHIKSAKCYNCRRSATIKKMLYSNYADLRFVELICGPPTFGSIAINNTESLPTLRLNGSGTRY
jgi:hypothetical protein